MNLHDVEGNPFNALKRCDKCRAEHGRKYRREYLGKWRKDNPGHVSTNAATPLRGTLKRERTIRLGLRKTNVEPNFGVSETKNTSENIASGTIRLVSSNHHNEEGLTGVNRSARPVRMLCHLSLIHI